MISLVRLRLFGTIFKGVRIVLLSHDSRHDWRSILDGWRRYFGDRRIEVYPSSAALNLESGERQKVGGTPLSVGWADGKHSLFQTLDPAGRSRQVSPVVIRLISVSDQLQLPDFHHIFGAILGWNGDLGYVIRIHGQELAVSQTPCDPVW